VVVVQPYTADYLDDCVTLLADAFVANPIHVAAFGAGRIDQNRLFFRIGLRRMFRGQAFVALVGGNLGGYLHCNRSPDCLPAPEDIPFAAATVLQPLGEAVPNLIRWFTRWCHHDPAESHVHLGPIGVAPALQGKGVGTALMRRYIEILERDNATGYLETDRAKNVEFYKKFGFVVEKQEHIIGTPSWYMWRRRGQ